MEPIHPARKKCAVTSFIDHQPKTKGKTSVVIRKKKIILQFHGQMLYDNCTVLVRIQHKTLLPSAAMLSGEKLCSLTVLGGLVFVSLNACLAEGIYKSICLIKLFTL